MSKRSGGKSSSGRGFPGRTGAGISTRPTGLHSRPLSIGSASPSRHSGHYRSSPSIGFGFGPSYYPAYYPTYYPAYSPYYGVRPLPGAIFLIILIVIIVIIAIIAAASRPAPIRDEELVP